MTTKKRDMTDHPFNKQSAIKHTPVEIPEGYTKEQWKWQTWASRCECCNKAIRLPTSETHRITKQFDPFCRECRDAIRNSVNFHEEDASVVYEIIWNNPEERMGGSLAGGYEDPEDAYQGGAWKPTME
jgi:hypothetical protein